MNAAPSSARRLVLLAACTGPLAFASGCVSIGNKTPTHVSYELRDLGEATSSPQHAPLDRVVLVSWTGASAFYDATSIVYSRSPGALAYYQFASWSERPAEQVGRLFARRLAGTGIFRDVASISAGVQGGWVVELELDEMLHDDAVPPGVARISMRMRIVDRSERRTIATRRFREEEPLRTESAESTVKALEVAVTRMIDASVRWVIEEALAAGSPASAEAGRASPAKRPAGGPGTRRALSAAGR